MAARANASICDERRVAGRARCDVEKEGTRGLSIQVGRQRSGWEQLTGAKKREGEDCKGMNATHPLTSAASPLRLSPIGAGEVEVAMLSDCDCDFSVNAVVDSGCDVITAIQFRRQDEAEDVGTVAS